MDWRTSELAPSAAMMRDPVVEVLSRKCAVVFGSSSRVRRVRNSLPYCRLSAAVKDIEEGMLDSDA